MKERRQKKKLERRNFLPTFILTLTIWVLVGLLVYFVEPDSFWPIIIFFILVFTGFLFTFSMILANTRRGILIALSVTLFLLLRYFGIGHIINFLLIAGLGITIELYFLKRA